MQAHNPNRIPTGVKIRCLCLSSLLLAYGTYGIYIDDLYIPRGRRRIHLLPDIHLHGGPAWIMYAALLCAVAILLSVVIDHYDTRDNEHDYRLFAKITYIAGLSLFGLALVLQSSSPFFTGAVLIVFFAWVYRAHW